MDSSIVPQVLTSPMFILKVLVSAFSIRVMFSAISMCGENKKEISKIKEKLNIE